MKQKLHKPFLRGLFKTLTIALLFAILCTSSGFAQTTVEIGAESYAGQALPMDPYYRYSYSQSIFLQSEINQSGDITKLRYYYNGYEAQTHDIVVYMGHTSEINFASGSSWINVVDYTEVYRGAFSTTTTAGWHEIVLTTPFAYDNTNNLVIAFDENEYEWGSGSSEFYCTAAAASANMSIVYYNDSNNPNPVSPPSGTIKAFRPNIQLEIVSPLPNDAGIEAIIPTGEFNAGVKDIKATLKNFGTDNLTGVTISWEVDETAQDNYSWVGNLAINETEQVVLGSCDFSEGTHAIKVFSSLPNGFVDENAANDTLIADVNAIVPIATFPWIENFDAATTIPAGWVNETTDDGDWTFVNTISSSAGNIATDNSGTGNFALFNALNFVDYEEVILTSPLLDLTSLDVANLEFYWQRPNSGYNERLIVNIYTDGVWKNDIITGLSNQVAIWQKVELDLTPYISSGVKIQFKVVSDNRSNIAIDEVQISGYNFVANDAGIVSIDNPGAEFAASVKDVTASIKNIGTSNLTSAIISWSVNGEAQPDYTWNGDLASNETEQVIIGSYNFSTLGTYSISASASLPNGVEDVNTINDSFITEVHAKPFISSFPWVESFENGGTIPSGWSLTSNGASNWDFKNSDGAHGADAGNSGTGYFARLDCYNIQASNNPVCLISPLLQLQAGSFMYLEYYTWIGSGSATNPLYIDISDNGKITWTELIAHDHSVVNTWNFNSIDLSAYAGKDIFIRFRGIANYGSGDCNINLDDIRVYQPMGMQYDSSTVTQSDGVISTGMACNVIGIEVFASGQADPVNANQFVFNTNGSTDALNDIENARLWYTGTSSVYDTINQFGSDIISPNGEFTITGTQALAEGPNYFWLTYNIKDKATLGNFADAECNSITIDSAGVTSSYLPVITAPEGNNEIKKIVLMPSGTGNTISSCGFTLLDNGGFNNYSNSFTGELTIYPGNPGDAIKIEFVSFETQSYYDKLSIYNGNTTTASLVGTYGDIDSIGIIESSAPDGSLTLKFVTNAYTEGLGWEANVSCFTPEPMTYVSSKATQNTELVSYNSPNEHVIGIQVVTTGTIPVANITGFVLNTNGCTNVADIDAARLWYTGTSNVFATTNQFGEDIIAPDGEFRIVGDTNLVEGINYFWLTYDISQDAGRDDFIDAECDSIIIDGTANVPSITAPMGSRTVERVWKMQEGTHSVTACDMIFYDNGGADDIYSKLFEGTLTFYPSTLGAGIQIEFLEFQTDSLQDNFIIYNGNSKYNTPIIAEPTGTLKTKVYKSTAADGSMTIFFDSDGFDDGSQGWKAKISCYTMENMAYNLSTTTQDDSYIAQNSTENVVVGIEVDASGYAFPLNISEFIFSTNGSSNPSTDIANAKLWYTGNDSVFNNKKQFGTLVDMPIGQFTFTGDQNLASGTNYFWLTYDINAGATIGNIVDAECDSFKLNENYMLPTITAPEGELEIAEVYAMSSGAGHSITYCGYILADEAGVDGNYSYGSNDIITLYPSNPNDVVAIDFYSFDLKEDYDHYISIYQGDTVREEALIEKIDYYDTPGRYMSSALDGSLTLKFVSDYSYLTSSNEGFMAGVFCLSTDPKLSNILVGGESLESFDPAITNYDIILQNGVIAIPTVDYVLADSRSEVDMLADTETPGNVSIKVVAENGDFMVYTINFTEEKAPEAANVMIIGTLQESRTLTVLYDYYDANAAEEGASEFKWYRSDDDQGLNKTEIIGETTLFYTLVEADVAKYITFEVTPVALTGILSGTPVETTVGPILPPPSLENSILTFDFNALDPIVTGNINETDFTVALTVPYGTDITTLVPTISISEKATVSPESGVVQDFGNDVIYTVTAENGDKHTYTVRVTIALNTENSITGFNFEEFDPGVNGVIDELSGKITLTVPFGTDLTSLIPIITISDEATVFPVTGVAQDFTNDVVYTVEAQNGDTKEFVVSVGLALNTENEVLVFTFEGLNPVVEANEIDHTKGRIKITVPYGTDITSLVPTIVVSTNATLTPATGVVQNFSNDVEYVVKAENGDERTYTVILTIALNHENSILSFDFEEFDPKVIGEIVDTTITLIVNQSSDISALAPVITVSPEATVNPVSGETQDFTKDVVYSVMALNGDIQEYVVKVDFNTGFGMNLSNVDINVYPNPNTGRFKLVISTERTEEYDIEIINVQGKVIFKSKILNEKDIDMSDFAKGIYYVRVNIKDNVGTKKILIQ